MLDLLKSSTLAQGRFRLGSMTLSERITEAIETSGVTVAAIAKRCGVTPQAVYQWMNGETKQISGENLVELADITGFDARWLAREAGMKRRVYPRTPQQAQVLELMQPLPETQQNLIVKIADSVAQPDGEASNQR
jgi:transcriptional regulator with XRE-family HTH domain